MSSLLVILALTMLVVQEGKKVTDKELRSFFVDYMRNDPLGKIANTHLAYASMLKAKARHDVVSVVCVFISNLDYAGVSSVFLVSPTG